MQRAAERIEKNLPDQDSKASKLLGQTFPEQIKRLRRIADESQLILDEVRVENTRRQAQNIYVDAGRGANQGKAGALKNLTSRSPFDQSLTAPLQNEKVTAYLKTHGFGTYQEAFDHALRKTKHDPRDRTERDLQGLQPELFTFTERSQSRTSAESMGLSAAELAAIQVYSVQDYRYINPATANDPAWMKANFPDLADKENKSLDEWAELQDQLAVAGQNLNDRLADRRKQLTGLREEGGLHTGVAMHGLRKMPVWKGTAYRGEKLDSKRFYSQFVKKGASFVPREPTFTWKTITSISKAESVARGFALMGSGTYRIVYQFAVTNGRDIEGMSLNRLEREVALLPGAEFAYESIEVTKPGKIGLDGRDDPWNLRITVRQVK